MPARALLDPQEEKENLRPRGKSLERRGSAPQKARGQPVPLRPSLPHTQKFNPASREKSAQSAHRPSGLSQHLSSLGAGVALDATTGGVVDEIVQHMHKLELKHLVSAAAIARNVNLSHRRTVVAWLVKVFHVVSFDDNILYGTVALADLYLDACGRTTTGTQLQSIVMACLCTMLKLQTAESRSYPVCELLSHITHNQISVNKVLQTEREVLSAVGFNVTSPTVLQWLETFSLRCASVRGGVSEEVRRWVGFHECAAPETVVGGPSGVRPKFVHLADYLCQIAMLNHLLVEVPPSLTAAAALILAMWGLDGPACRKQLLLEDIMLVWSVKRHDQGERLKKAVADLYSDWVIAQDGGLDEADERGLRVVNDKFRAPGRHEVSLIPAPDAVPVFSN